MPQPARNVKPNSGGNLSKLPPDYPPVFSLDYQLSLNLFGDLGVPGKPFGDLGKLDEAKSGLRASSGNATKDPHRDPLPLRQAPPR